MASNRRQQNDRNNNPPPTNEKYQIKMTKEKFVNTYLEKLIVKDDEVRGYFESAETDEERESLRNNLRMSLENAYDAYGKEYFESKGIGSYISTALRWGGAAADVTGTYTFWSLGPAGVHITAPAAAGFKGVAIAEKSLADLIDSQYYLKHGKTKGLTDKVKDSTKIVAEGALERAAAYTPFTFGVAETADLFRGKSKYDAKVTTRTLQYAKENFMNQDRGPRKISLTKFENPAYTESNLTTAA